jgi:hypothetical protein
MLVSGLEIPATATEPSRGWASGSFLVLCQIGACVTGNPKAGRPDGLRRAARLPAHRGAWALHHRLRTSQISGFHGADYEERRLRGCDALWLL